MPKHVLAPALAAGVVMAGSGADRRFGPSEANRVIDNYNRLGEREKQDILNFLRSL